MNSSLNLDISTFFDTGTSFTYLADPAYSFLSETVSESSDETLAGSIGNTDTVLIQQFLFVFIFQFDAQVQLNRYATDSRIPFEYCYSMRLFFSFFQLLYSENLFPMIYSVSIYLI